MSEHPVGSGGSSGSGPPTAAPSADAQVLEPAVGPDAALLLLHAAGKGDAALVGTLCELGVDPNATHPMMEPAGAAPLHMAAQTAGGDAVIRALAAAAGSTLNLNPRNCSGETPLMYAACYGHAANVHALLELGSETEAADECGRTALMMAASAGHAECAAELLAFNASTSASCRAGPNALFFAAGCGHARCVELLAPASPAETRLPAVEFAAKAQSAPCLRALAAGGMTAQEALRAVYIVMASKRLVSVCVSADDFSCLATQEAAPLPGNQAACIGALAAAGADLNAPFPGNPQLSHCPLMHAVEVGNVECVRALLQHGASPSNPRPADGATPLHMATGCAEIVQLLLSHGTRSAVALSAAAGGVTPLMRAVMAPNLEAVQVLLAAPDAAAALEMRGVSGKTALALAVWCYRKHGDAAAAAAVIKALLAAGADCEAADNDGARPLHWAADSGFTEAARLLLEAGAVPAASSTRGFTPLRLAQHFKHPETAAVIEEAVAGKSVMAAHASAVADAIAARRPPPPLPAGVEGPVISCTKDLATGKVVWLQQEGATTTVIPGPAGPEPGGEQQASCSCCCIQ